MEGQERIKLLIELSETVDEADGVVEQFSGYSDIGRKYAFLRGMFPEVVVVTRQIPENQTADEIEQDDYYFTLHSIINKKWR